MSTEPVIGIIGGSGLYGLSGLTDTEWLDVASPFGRPSDQLLVGRLGALKVVFLPRHGRGHPIPPDAINYRANIDALKRLGVTDLISLSAVGSLAEALEPGTFVMVDQFIDRTVKRESSFFGPGCVAHVSMAHPTCARLAGHLLEAARGLSIRAVPAGTYLAMEGPQFSSLAESELYRSWKCDVIGMTNMPEAKLAREAELCYGLVAMVTDYDCWHPEHEHVTVASVIAVLNANAEKARSLVEAVLPRLASHRGPCERGCQSALDHALITAPEARDPTLVQKLDAVAGRVLRR